MNRRFKKNMKGMIQMKTIYLIGFMGSGKSQVGASLQRNYNLSFIDTDNYIEKKYSKDIPTIFKEEGEDQFRVYEIETLKNLKDYGVIATGGGIVEREENYQTMKENGTTIYLKTSFDAIMMRLKYDQSRPLWNQSIEERRSLYEKRKKKYTSFSDEVVCTDTLTVEEISKAIMKLTQKE